MKLRTTMVAFLFAAGALAACQGGTTYAPSTASLGGDSQAALSHASLPAPFGELANSIPDDTSCGSDSKLPGTYITMAAFGTVKGTTFTGDAALSFWFANKYTKGTKPTPSPSPGTTPTPHPTASPKPITIYLYTGTYTTNKTKQSGCAILFITKSGKPIEKGIDGNGIAGGSPQFSYPYVNTGATTAQGSMKLTISGLSASGGHGNATLTSAKGKPYDTAVFTLTKRIVSKF